MKAMILAAGTGTRLRPLTERLPKVMVPVAGKPLLEHTIVHLASNGISHLVINLSHCPEVVQSYFGDGKRFGVQITYSLEPHPLGTAAGLKRVERLFRDGPFIVWYGDNISRCDIQRMVGVHRAQEALVTMAVHWREDVAASGIVGLDESGRIRRFLEKPGQGQVFSHWVNAGILVLDPAVLDKIPDTAGVDLSRDVFPALVARGERLLGYRLSKDEGLWWIDTPADLERVTSIWEVTGRP